MQRNPNSAPLTATVDSKKARRWVYGDIPHDKRVMRRRDRRAAKDALRKGNVEVKVVHRLTAWDVS